MPVVLQLAQFYDRLGQEDRAAALYDRVLQKEPANPTALTNLAVQKIEGGAVADAIALWRTALAANPALTGTRLNLAVALFRSGDVKAAESAVRRALHFEPDNPSALRLLDEIQALVQP